MASGTLPSPSSAGLSEIGLRLASGVRPRADETPGRSGYSKLSLWASTSCPVWLTRNASSSCASALWEVDLSTAAPETSSRSPGSPGE